jgi:hypothetical protein
VSDCVVRLAFEFWEEFHMVQLLKARVPVKHGSSKASHVVARRRQSRIAAFRWRCPSPPLIG